MPKLSVYSCKLISRIKTIISDILLNVECLNLYFVACNCNGLGSSSSECDDVTGKCVCGANVTGDKCDVCIDQHWGHYTGVHSTHQLSIIIIIYLLLKSYTGYNIKREIKIYKKGKLSLSTNTPYSSINLTSIK